MQKKSTGDTLLNRMILQTYAKLQASKTVIKIAFPPFKKRIYFLKVVDTHLSFRYKKKSYKTYLDAIYYLTLFSLHCSNITTTWKYKLKRTRLDVDSFLHSDKTFEATKSSWFMFCNALLFMQVRKSQCGRIYSSANVKFL